MTANGSNNTNSNGKRERDNPDCPEPASIEDVLVRIGQSARSKGQVSVRSVMNAVGSRSFGPLVLTAGLILASPLSGIPGLPTAMAIFVVLVATQLLMRRDHFWLPGWLLDRSVSSARLEKALAVLRAPARIVDKPLRPRLTRLTYDGGAHLAAGACIVIAVFLPPLEILPFVSSIGGIALAAFGLSLIANDGALALLAYAVVFGGLAILGFTIL